MITDRISSRTSRGVAGFTPKTICLSGSKNLHLNWVVSAKALPKKVCDRFEALGGSFSVEEPTVVGEDKLQAHRVAEVHLIPWQPETMEMYQLLWDTALDATTRHYGLKLSGISRMPHYVEYHSGNGHFHWHDDYSHESEESPRKLTVVLQLSDGAEYKGGDLEVFGATTTAVPRTRGTLICLPSFVPHRVTPVVSGVRRVIVAWIAGPRLV